MTAKGATQALSSHTRSMLFPSFSQVPPRRASRLRGVTSKTCTEEENAAIESAWMVHKTKKENKKDGDRQIVHFSNGVHILARDMRKLRPGEWLNDKIIDACLETLLRRERHLHGVGDEKSYFFSCMLYFRLVRPFDQNRAIRG